jgi:hypothetical protein
MGISFKKKSDFHLSNGVFPIFCYEISATALAGRFCVARGTRDTKIQVIDVSVSSLYISSLCLSIAELTAAVPCTIMCVRHLPNA